MSSPNNPCTRPDCPVCLANAPPASKVAPGTTNAADTEAAAWVDPLCVVGALTKPQEAQTLRECDCSGTGHRVWCKTLAVNGEAYLASLDLPPCGCPPPGHRMACGYRDCECSPPRQRPVESVAPVDTVGPDLQQPREFPYPYTTPEPHVHHWCSGCQASKPRWHVHGDPLEDLVWGELLEKCRELIATAAKEPKP